jgi:hypothetical protein
VRILGLDPLNDRHRLHQRIGVQLQLGCVNGSRTMRTPESGCMT